MNCVSVSFSLVNGIGEDVSVAVMMGKVIRPLRSVDPSQTEYQGLIEVSEEGGHCVVVWHFKCTAYPQIKVNHPPLSRLFQVALKARLSPLGLWVCPARPIVCRKEKW